MAGRARTVAVVMMLGSWPASSFAAPAETPAAVPPGFVEMYVAAVLPTRGGPAVVLRDKTEKTLIPIWIGTSEAHSIQLRLDRRRFPRPLTHDLLDAIVHDLGGQVVKIHVDDLKGETFVGTVFIRQGERLAHFDARASDSIALAVGAQVPIFVSEKVVLRIKTKKDKVPEIAVEEEEDEEDEEAPARETKALPGGAQTL